MSVRGNVSVYLSCFSELSFFLSVICVESGEYWIPRGVREGFRRVRRGENIGGIPKCLKELIGCRMELTNGS